MAKLLVPFLKRTGAVKVLLSVPSPSSCVLSSSRGLQSQGFSQLPLGGFKEQHPVQLPSKPNNHSTLGRDPRSGTKSIMSVLSGLNVRFRSENFVTNSRLHFAVFSVWWRRRRKGKEVASGRFISFVRGKMTKLQFTTLKMQEVLTYIWVKVIIPQCINTLDITGYYYNFWCIINRILQLVKHKV